MKKVYIVDAKRSPIGSFLGKLSDIKAHELLGQVVNNVLKINEIEPYEIDEVIIGNVLSAGQGQGIARQACIYAGIPYKVPAYNINMVCGSGMKSIMNAYTQIKYGISNIVVAGGVEVMSQAPFIVNSNVRSGNKLGHLSMIDTILSDGLTCGINNYHMGITAENLAAKYCISREKQDEFSLKSQEKALKAIKDNRFKEEIVDIDIKLNKNSYVFKIDEYPNRNTDLIKLSKLKSVFKENGTVTAGNSSGINDGASALLIVSEDIINKYNLEPMAEIIEISQCGVEPSIMGIGPSIAIEELIKKSNIKFEDIDLLEINEAFAAQVLSVVDELKFKFNVDDKHIYERLNVNGGAIALGHPLGASGSRIVTTLCHEMKKRYSKYGIASLCIGGGMGTAILLKNMK